MIVENPELSVSFRTLRLIPAPEARHAPSPQPQAVVQGSAFRGLGFALLLEIIFAGTAVLSAVAAREIWHYLQ